MTMNERLYLILFNRHVRHSEPAHDHEYLWIQPGRAPPPAYRYYPHICDFLAFVSSRSRDKDLLGMQTPYGNRKEFNKWCTSAHTSVIDNLVTIFKL
jgi:hypothetical protein